MGEKSAMGRCMICVIPCFLMFSHFFEQGNRLEIGNQVIIPWQNWSHKKVNHPFIQYGQ
jgi:hypothetical protein